MGLRQLGQLRILVLANIVPMDRLPASLMKLSLGIILPLHLPAEAKLALMEYDGSLQNAHLHLPAFDNNPRRLNDVPCIQHAEELHLSLVVCSQTHSRWCPGFFQRLQVLNITILHSCHSFDPDWDLGTCSLSEFHLCVQVSSNIGLRQITNVQADLVVLQLMRTESGMERCSLDCGSWTVDKAQVQYEKDSFLSGFFPACVSDAVGALMFTQGKPPKVAVNGLAPVRAAAAVAKDGDLELALRESLDCDPELYYESYNSYDYSSSTGN